MRKIIQEVILIAFFLSMILLISGISRKILKEKLINRKIALLPSFSFTTLNKDYFYSSEIKKGPVLIVRFHPECDHCQYEISQILNSDIPSLVSRALLISSGHPDSISKFLKQFNYSDYPSIVALADTSCAFESIFGNDIVPSNYIYNRELKLVKVLLGEVKTETIRKYLHVHE
jgi:hypothetical protein